MSCKALWCLLCYENRKGRTNHQGHRGHRPPRLPYVAPIWERVREMKERAKADGHMKGEPAKGLMADYRLLWEMLTADTYDSGKKRRRSTLLLMCDGPVAKVLLMDKDTNEQAWFCGESFDQALQSIEESLTVGAVVWQQAKLSPPPRQR